MYINLSEGINGDQFDNEVDFAATGEEADIARIVYESAIEFENLQEAAIRMSAISFKAILSENVEVLHQLAESEQPKFIDRMIAVFKNAYAKVMAFLKAAFDTVQKFIISDKNFVTKYEKLIAEKKGSGSIKMNASPFNGLDGLDLGSIESKLNGILSQNHFVIGAIDFATQPTVRHTAGDMPATKDKMAAAIVSGATESTLRSKLEETYIGKESELNLNAKEQLAIVNGTKDQLKAIEDIRKTIKESYEKTLKELSDKKSEISKVKVAKYEGEGDAYEQNKFKHGEIANASKRETHMAVLSMATSMTNAAKSMVNTTGAFKISALKKRRAQAKNAVVKYVHGSEAEATSESTISSLIWQN